MLKVFSCLYLKVVNKLKEKKPALKVVLLSFDNIINYSLLNNEIDEIISRPLLGKEIISVLSLIKEQKEDGYTYRECCFLKMLEEKECVSHKEALEIYSKKHDDLNASIDDINQKLEKKRIVSEEKGFKLVEIND